MDVNRYAPSGKLSRKHLVTLASYTEEDIYEILLRASEISKSLAVGEKPTYLKNKKIALITKSGLLRPRLAFEKAVTSLSGNAVVCQLTGSEIETLVSDGLTMSAIAGYGINAAIVQTEQFKDAEQIEKLVEMPIINANGKCGPCESLSALYTVWKRRGTLGNAKITMIGNPAEFKDSFVYAFATCGFEITFVCPEEMRPSEEILNYCLQYGGVRVSYDMQSGLGGSDIVLVSEDGLPEQYTLSGENYRYAKEGALILHTLPVPQGGGIDGELLSVKGFCGLDQALALPEIEMAALSLLAK
ncbi:MAG: hypothetical protein IJS67_01400 [Clostridia bacterium]|nr:hypothetical protein [Clostridia bacterium]